MNFVDHTGHIYSIPSYNENPIGHEYDIQPYIFWLSSEYTGRLSINNYYILPIRLLLDKVPQKIDIEINDSEVFSLYSTRSMHDLVNGLDSLNSYIEIDEKSFVKSLTIDDLIGYNLDGTNKILVPFYATGIATEDGTLMTSGIIHIVYDDGEEWAPITLGGEFYDENEALIINGRNMGISLPKDILGAIYQSSYYNEVPDEALYASKIREYLLSYMNIKGQVGNFNSILNAIEWFGYGKKIEVQKLLQNDNQFMDQFFLDDFDISTNIYKAIESFRSSTYISLRLWDNQETDDTEPQKFMEPFTLWGEGKPIMDGLFKKTIVKHYDEGDIDFYRSYYDYAFDEMGLKLAMLGEYFKKYFMPIHLFLHSTSISHQVFANDVKMINVPSVAENAGIVMANDAVQVIFDTRANYYIYNQTFYTDYAFNNLEGPNRNSVYKYLGEHTDEEVLYIDEPCIEIPITYIGEGIFKCHYILLKDEIQVYESDFIFNQSSDILYKSFILLPRYINDLKKLTVNYWLDSNYRLAILCNDRWYYHDFNIRMPEMDLGLGLLRYQYYTSLDNYETIDLNEDRYDDLRHKYGYDPDSEIYGSNVRNIVKGIGESLHKQLNRLTEDDIDFNSFMYVPSLVENNDINFYKKLDAIQKNVNGDENSEMSTGILTRNEIIKTIKKKTYLKDFSNQGIAFDDRLIKAGTTIIPNFYFNDYTKDDNGNPKEGAYEIETFYVDIYYGFYINYLGENVPYATQRVDIIKDGELVVDFGDNRYGLVDDNIINQYPVVWSEDFEQKDGPFTMDDCIIANGQTNFIIRLVWNIKLKTEKEFISSYDKHGTPYDGYYKDIVVRLKKPDGCSHTNCLMMKLMEAGSKYRCIFKTDDKEYQDIIIDYNETGHEEFDSDESTTTSRNLIIENINRLLQKSQSKFIISSNKKYLNQIHIYNIYRRGKKVEEGGYEEDPIYYNEDGTGIFDQILAINEPILYNAQKYGDPYKNQQENGTLRSLYRQNLAALYGLFFKQGSGDSYIEMNEHSYFDYDFYLMHDDSNWYGVFISRMPIYYGSDRDLVGPESFIYTDPNGHDFEFVHYRSGDKFLINRMYYIDSEGRNIFNQDDLICATIDNVNFPIVLSKGTKWKISPMSFGIDVDNNTSESYTNSCIFSVGQKENKYMKGYYNIDVRYSIDGNIEHQQMKQARLKIV